MKTKETKEKAWTKKKKKEKEREGRVRQIYVCV